MPNSNYPFGWNNGVTIRGIPVLNSYPGNVFWVSSTASNASDMNPGTYNQPCATIAGALVFCTAAKGDIIICNAGHAETISAAGGIALAKSGVAVVGLGQGANRPTLTWATSAAATLTITAANVSIQNIVGICNIDQLVTALSVTAAGAWVDMEWQETADNKEAISFITGSAAANKIQINLKYRGRTGGSHCVNPVVLNGSDGAIVNLDFYGKASTAVVNFVTVAVTNVEVYGYIYNSGDTTGAKLVVDTITGSTWYASVNAGAAGSGFSGGSGAAMASDDVSTIASNMAVPVADATTNTLERDVVGNKTDAGVTAVGTTKSITAYAKGLVTMGTVQAQDSTANAFEGDVTGNKTDTAVFVAGTTKSLTAYAKGMLTLSKRVNTVALANTDFTGTVTRWTITGGPIIIRHIGLLITTVLPAGANTLKFSITPTGGGATDLCGATDTASAATAQLFIVDGTKATEHPTESTLALRAAMALSEGDDENPNPST